MKRSNHTTTYSVESILEKYKTKISLPILLIFFEPLPRRTCFGPSVFFTLLSSIEVFPDDEMAVYVRHRSCPQTPLCPTCALDDLTRSVKNNECHNIGICGRWRKALLLQVGERDTRLQSDEAKAQRKSIGWVN